MKVSYLITLAIIFFIAILGTQNNAEAFRFGWRGFGLRRWGWGGLGFRRFGYGLGFNPYFYGGALGWGFRPYFYSGVLYNPWLYTNSFLPFWYRGLTFNRAFWFNPYVYATPYYFRFHPLWNVYSGIAPLVRAQLLWNWTRAYRFGRYGGLWF